MLCCYHFAVERGSRRFDMALALNGGVNCAAGRWRRWRERKRGDRRGGNRCTKVHLELNKIDLKIMFDIHTSLLYILHKDRYTSVLGGFTYSGATVGRWICKTLLQIHKQTNTRTSKIILISFPFLTLKWKERIYMGYPSCLLPNCIIIARLPVE